MNREKLSALKKQAVQRGREMARRNEHYPMGAIGFLEPQFTEGLAMADEYNQMGLPLKSAVNLFHLYAHIISQGDRGFSSRYLVEIKRRLEQFKLQPRRILSCGSQEDTECLLNHFSGMVEETLGRYAKK